MENRIDRPGVGVGVLICRGDRILLLHRINAHGAGTWSAPGGHLEFGESPEACAIRETKEETGLDINPPMFLVLTNDLFYQDKKHYITIWMKADFQKGEPVVNAPSESDAIGWFTWDKLPDQLFVPFQNLLKGETYPKISNLLKIKP